MNIKWCAVALIFCIGLAEAQIPNWVYANPRKLDINPAPTDPGQNVLLIYARTADYPFVPAEWPTLDNQADTTRLRVTAWHRENSWGGVRLNLIPHRAPDGTWFQLPRRLQDYVESPVRPMEHRDPTLATTVSPTPVASVAANAARAPAGGFPAGSAGKYFYAVASVRNGVESVLTASTAAVDVAEGEMVTLSIGAAAVSDATSYRIYRAKSTAAPSPGDYARIGEAGLPLGAPFIDTGYYLDKTRANIGELHRIVQDALDVAVPSLPQPLSAIKAVVVVLHAPSEARGQAYYSPQQFKVGGVTHSLQCAYVDSHGSFVMAHEIGHLLQAPDLYPEPVDPGGPPRVGNWDVMDCTECTAQFTAWEKTRRSFYQPAPVPPFPPILHYVTVSRPAPGTPAIDRTFQIWPTSRYSTTPGDTSAIKIEIGQGISYFVEARRPNSATVSEVGIPGEQIVVTRALDVLPASILPRRNVSLISALNPGGVVDPDPAVRIQYVSRTAGPDPAYNVRVTYRPLPQPDLSITPIGAPPWESPDIWIDSRREGGGFRNPADPPLAINERAWIGQDNRIWARVTNVGQGQARGVRVVFKFNSPGGIGDSGGFISLPAATPASFNLGPGESRNVYTVWKPTSGDHICVSVEVDIVPGESNFENNSSSENITDFYTGSSSPWHELPLTLDVANPLKTSTRIELAAEGIPPGWTVSFDKASVDLPAQGNAKLRATITPNATDPQCTKAELNVFGQILAGDVWLPYSGYTPIVHLANPLQIANTITAFDGRRQNANARVRGCTNPPQPNRELAIQIKGPNGETTVVFVQTDSRGCYDKLVLSPIPGMAEIKTYFSGSDCAAPTESPGVKIRLHEPFVAGRLWAGLAGGISFVTGDRRRTHWGGPHIAGHLEADVAPGWRAGVEAGEHWLLPRQGASRLAITHVTGTVKFLRQLNRFRAYAAGGPGIYRAGGSTGAGAQIGLGLEGRPKERLRIFGQFSAHNASLGRTLRWVDLTIGLSVRIR